MHRLLRTPFLLLTLAASNLLADTPATPAPAADEPARKTAGRLSVRDLKAGEKVVVTYVSAGPGYLLRRLYSIEGGTETKFTAIEQESVYDGKRRELKSDLEPIGETVLTHDEKNGVENYFTFLRMEYKGNCYAYDKLTLDHYRDGRLIGTESFHDRTCVATWFTRKNGRIVRNGDAYQDFPVEVLWSMVPVLLIEQRIWEEIRKEKAEG